MKNIYPASNSLYKGFTLIELIITVAIIGILTSIAINSYGKYKKAPQKAAAKLELGNIKETLNYVHSVEGGYHSFLYPGGYRLPKTIKAWGGMPSNITNTIPCDIFPTKTKINTQHSRHFTLTKNVYTAKHRDNAMNSFHVCDRTANKDCTVGFFSQTPDTVIGTHLLKDATAATTNPCKSLVTQTSSDYTFSCDTYRFPVYTSLSGKNKKYFLVTDHTGAICSAESGKTWKENN